MFGEMISRSKVVSLFASTYGRNPSNIEIERFLCGNKWNDVLIKEQMTNDYEVNKRKLIVNYSKKFDRIDPNKEGYEHLFFISSTAIGGVERIISLMLECVGEEIKSKCLVITSTSNNIGISFGNVRVVFQPVSEWNRILLFKYKTIWVQPFIGFDSYVKLAIERGSRVYWFIVSSFDRLIYMSKNIQPTYYISTCRELDSICFDNGLVPFITIPHFVSDPIMININNRSSTNLAYVGRCSYEKNVEDIFLVLSKLQKCYNLRLFFPINNSPNPTKDIQLFSSIKDRINSSVFADRVNIIIDENDVEKIYKDVDCILLPSIYEGYSMVAHEAVVRGIPVVLSSHLSICAENNPGFVPFNLHNNRDLDNSSLVEMANAIIATSSIDRRSIADFSKIHTRTYFVNNYLSLFLRELSV